MRTAIWADILSAAMRDLIFFLKGLVIKDPANEGFARQLMAGVYAGHDISTLLSHAKTLLPREDFERYLKEYSPEERKYAFTRNTVMMVATIEAWEKYSVSKDPDKKLGQFFFDSAKKWGSRYSGASPLGFNIASATAPIGYLSQTSSYLNTGRQAVYAFSVDARDTQAALAIIDSIALLKSGKDKAELKKMLTRDYFYDIGPPPTGAESSLYFDTRASVCAKNGVAAFINHGSAKESFKESVVMGIPPMIATSLGDVFYGYESIPADVRQVVDDTLPSEMLDVLASFEEKYVLRT